MEDLPKEFDALLSELKIERTAEDTQAAWQPLVRRAMDDMLQFKEAEQLDFELEKKTPVKETFEHVFNSDIDRLKAEVSNLSRFTKSHLGKSPFMK